MRILVHAASLHGYGSGNVGRNILAELGPQADGHQIEAWVPSEWKDKIIPPRNTFYKYISKPGIIRKFWTENIPLRKRIAVSGPDILFSLGDTSLPAAGVPHLLLIQQAYVSYPMQEFDFCLSGSFKRRIKLMKKYFQLGIPRISLFTVQTEVMRNRLIEQWKIDPQKVVVVPSSVKVYEERYSPVIDEKSPPYVCYVASAGPHKNFEVLARMMAALKKNNIDLRLKLTILPESIPGFKQKLEDLKVRDRVDFLGGVDQAKAMKLIANSAGIILPSKLEAFPLPYYESMAIGCPAIAADRDFARGALGDTGMYADADDGEAFAGHVISLLESEDLRRTMSAAALQRFESTNITWKQVSRKYLDLIERCV